MPERSGPRPEPTQRVARVAIGEEARAAAARVSWATEHLNGAFRSSVRAAAVAEDRAQRLAAIMRTEPEEEECDCLECRAYYGDPERGERAEALLVGHLDKQQREKYNLLGYFEVAGASSTLYRLYVLPPAPVIVLTGEYSGSNLCIQTAPNYHHCDAALARKLMIETAEDEFLATACGLRVGSPRLGVLPANNARVLVDGVELPAVENLTIHFRPMTMTITSSSGASVTEVEADDE